MSAISESSNAVLEIGTATAVGPSAAASLVAIGSDTMRPVPNMTKCDPPQAGQAAKKEVTLDGNTLSFPGIPQWGDFDGEFLTAYLTTTQATHNDLIADVAVNGGRFRNFRVTEPDAGARVTSWVGCVTECKGGAYVASESGSARRHTLKIAVLGIPTVTP